MHTLLLYAAIVRHEKTIKINSLFRHVVARIIIGFSLEYDGYDLIQIARFVLHIQFAYLAEYKEYALPPRCGYKTAVNCVTPCPVKICRIVTSRPII